MLKKVAALCFAIMILITVCAFGEEPASAGQPVQTLSAVFKVGDPTYRTDRNTFNIDAGNLNIVPYIDGVSNRVYIPVRALCEALNCVVAFDEETQVITVTGIKRTVAFKVNSDQRKINDRDYPMDADTVIKEDRTFLPARLVAEALGIRTEWREGAQEVAFRYLIKKDFSFLDKDTTFDGFYERIGAIGLEVGSGLHLIRYELQGGYYSIILNFTDKLDDARIVFPNGVTEEFDFDRKAFVAANQGDFSLVARSIGFFFPGITEVFIFGDGQMAMNSYDVNGILYAESYRQISKEDLDSFIAVIVTENDFFNLPEHIQADEKKGKILDADYQNLEVRYNGRQHSSGGYAASFYNQNHAAIRSALSALLEKYHQ